MVGEALGLDVVEEDPEGRRVDVVELAVADGPAEGEDSGEGERERERDEGEEDVHGRSAARRNDGWSSARATTRSDETGIAAAATSGVTSPATAAPAPSTL